MPIAIIGAAIIGGVMGMMTSASDRNAAQAAMQSAVAQINAIGAPPDLAQQIILQHFQQAGILTPQLAQAIPQEFQKAVQIVENPAMRTSQTGSLAAMQNLAQTGFGPQDIAAMQALRNQTSGDAQARQNQIMQQFQSMGQGGSGANLAAMLSGAQSAGQQEANQAVQIGGQAAQARRDAIAQAASQASNIRGQDYATLAQNAANQQAWQNNLLQNAESRNMYNTQTQNQSNLYNTQRQQQVNDMNTQQANAEALRERQAQQQMWQDQLAAAQAKANAQLGQAGYYGQQAQQTAQGWQKMGTGVSSGLASVYGAQQKQPAAPATTTTPDFQYNPAQNGGGIYGGTYE